MAVKVMLAPALAKRDEAPVKSSRAGAEPKRRRPSVYDADGNEVFITLVCLKCHKMGPLSLFGLRKMADGATRNQPWCRTCRSGSSAANETPAKNAPALAAEKIVDPGTIAAQVVAALHNGRR